MPCLGIGRGLRPWVRIVVSGWQSTYPSSPWIFPASLNSQRLGHYQAAIGQGQNSFYVSLQKGGARDPGDSSPISLPCRSCFCLGHGHQLTAGHRAGGGCLEPRGDDRQTTGEPHGLICVQWRPAHRLTSQGQGTELMKRLRAWLPAPPPFVLEQGSRDDYRLQQASPSP